MHKLLLRQLKRYVGSVAPIPEEWKSFVDAVDKAYQQADADRALLERSMDLTSEELLERNQELRQDIARRKRAEEALRRAHAELEMRVQERTAELAQANEALQADIAARVRAEEEVRRRAEDVALLHSLNTAANRGESLQEIIRLLSKETKKIIPSEGITVYLVSEDQEYLVMQNLVLSTAMVKRIERLIGTKIPTVRIPLKAGSLHLETLRTGRPLLTNDPATVQRLVAEFVETDSLPGKVRKTLKKFMPQIVQIVGAESVIIAPLVLEGESIGVLSISSKGPLTEPDLHRLEAISGQLTAVIKRKQAEEALRESEERYRLHFENVTDAVFSIDLESRILSISPSVERVLGYAPEGLIGKRFSELNILAPESLENALSDVMRVLAGEHVVSSVYEFIAKDGTIKIGEVSSAPLIRDGEVVGVVSVARDTTERRRAEEALRESEEKYRKQFEEALDAIFVADAETGILIDCNRAACELVGWEESELVGKHQRDLHPPGKTEGEFGGVFEQHREGEEGQVLETRVITKTGEIREVAIKASPFELGGRKVLQGTFRDVTERKRAEEEAQRRAAQAALIYEVGQRVSGELELDALLSEIVTAVCDTFDYYSAMLLLLDEEAERLTLRSIAGGYTNVFPDDLWLAVGEGMIGHAAATGATQVSGDVSKNPHYVRKAEEETKSELVVPIKSGQRVIGVLDIQSNEFDAFDESATMAMETLSTQIATAINNARLFESARTQAKELAVLNELGQALTARLNVGQVLEEAYRGASRLMDTKSFYVALYNPDGDEVTFALDVVEGEVRKPHTAGRAGQGLTEYIIRNRKSLLIQEKVAERLEELEIEQIGLAACSWLGVPLIIGNQVLGVMAVQSHTKPRVYDAHDRDLLLSIASQTAIALQNACLFEETQRWVTQLALINDVGEKIAAVLDMESLLERAVRLVQESFGYHHVAVFTLDREQDELIMRARAGDIAHLYPPDHRLKLGQGMVGQASLHNETLLANDVDADPRYVNLYPGVVQTRSELSVPIRVGGEVIGVLDVQSLQLDAFDKDDVMVLETLANQIAVAFNNARLYETVQQELAERKQAEEAIQQRNRELGTLYEAATAISSDLSLDMVLQAVADQMSRALGSEGCTLSRWDRERDVVETLVDYSAASPESTEPPGTTYDLRDYPTTRSVLETRQSAVIQRQDAAANGAELAFMKEAGIYTILMVPLVAGDHVLGLAELFDEEPRDYTAAQIRLAQSLATQAAVAIENGRLYEEAKRRGLEQETLREAALTLTTTLEWSEVVERILAQLQQVIPYDTASVQLLRWDQGGERLEIVGGRGFPNLEEIVGLTFDLSREDNPNREVIRTRAPFIVGDAPEVYQEFRRGPHAPADIRSWLGVPMLVGDRPVGMIALDKSEPGFYTPQHCRLAEAFAAQAAIALENARLHTEILGHAKQLEQRVQERTAQLAAEHARLEAILYSTTDGIVVTDGGGNVIQTNPVAQAWLTQTLVPEEAEQLRKAIRNVATHTEEQSLELLELTGLDLEVEAAPISEPGLDEAAAVVAIHNVSHLKSLDRMRTRFITNISHELRTPVTAIKLYAHLMQKRSEKWGHYLDVLTQEADHQAQLIEDILEISRIDSGRLEIKPLQIPLDELTAPIVASHQAPAQEKGLPLEYLPAGVDTITLADPAWIAQVLDNLMDNAIRYTAEGGKVTVSTGKQEAEGRTWATVTVADTGMGIPEQDLPHIFERFFRGEEPRAMQLTGTGLGLSIVKEILELHGGRITVESEAGAGSAFTVWLPLVEEKQAGFALPGC